MGEDIWICAATWCSWPPRGDLVVKRTAGASATARGQQIARVHVSCGDHDSLGVSVRPWKPPARANLTWSVSAENFRTSHGGDNHFSVILLSDDTDGALSSSETTTPAAAKLGASRGTRRRVDAPGRPLRAVREGHVRQG